MSLRSRQWLVSLILVFFGLTLGLSLVLPLLLAAAGALTAMGLSWPFVRWIASRRPSATTMDRQSTTTANLHRLSPSAFEAVIARVFQSLGFAVDEMDYRGDTYLADFILQHERRGEIAVAIALQQPPDEVVNEDSLEDLKRAVERFKASRGILVTTGQIPEPVKRSADAEDAPIDLIDGTLLRKLTR